MDFIVELPPSKDLETGLVYKHIMTVTDILTKRVRLILTNSLEAEHAVVLFHKYIFLSHSLPEVAVSDRGTQFVSALFRRVCARLSIKQNLSTAFYPETDR